MYFFLGGGAPGGSLKPGEIIYVNCNGIFIFKWDREEDNTLNEVGSKRRARRE